MEDRNTKETVNAKGFRVELVVDFHRVEIVGRLNNVCWRNLDVCVLYCNNGFGGIECEE